jgi:hypothetical protein
MVDPYEDAVEEAIQEEANNVPAGTDPDPYEWVPEEAKSDQS